MQKQLNEYKIRIILIILIFKNYTINNFLIILGYYIGYYILGILCILFYIYNITFNIYYNNL